MAIRLRTLALVFFLSLLLLSACTGVGNYRTTPGEDASRGWGDIRIAAFTPQSLPEGMRPYAMLENDGLKRELPLQSFSNGFTAVATGLPIGDWVLRVELRDPAGDLTHTAEETVRIYRGVENFVEVQLTPVDALFEFIADLSSFPDRDLVEGARVSFAGGGYFSLTPVEDSLYLFRGERSVNEGDYEFSVALYGESFYAADRLYQSPWESVRFFTGKTTQVEWSPEFGATQVHIEIIYPPPIPTGIGCYRDSEGLWIIWEAGHMPAETEVLFYARNDEYRPYSIIGQQDAEAGLWLLEPKHEDSLAIVMTSRNAGGIESFRSEPIVPQQCDEAL